MPLNRSDFGQWRAEESSLPVTGVHHWPSLQGWGITFSCSVVSHPTPEIKARGIQPGSTSWKWWKCRLSSEKCWLHTCQLKKVFLACLFSFIISTTATAQSIGALLRDMGTSGDTEVLQGQHSPSRAAFIHSKVQTRTPETILFKILQYKVSHNHNRVQSFFPQSYHQVLSTSLCLSKSPVIWYIIPCNFLIIVTCRILPCSTVRILGLTNTPGMAPEELGKEQQRKIQLKFSLKYTLKWFL